jgi:hypothetical protein
MAIMKASQEKLEAKTEANQEKVKACQEQMEAELKTGLDEVKTTEVEANQQKIEE